METRLLRGAGMADYGIPEGSSVQCVQLFYTDAGCTRYFPERTRTLYVTAGFHAKETGFIPGPDVRNPVSKRYPPMAVISRSILIKRFPIYPTMSSPKNLVAQHGVAAIPVSAFYQSGKDDKAARFCFAKKEADPFGWQWKNWRKRKQV